MRTLIILSALLTFAAPAVSAATIVEEMDPHDVQLDQVVDKPTAFLGMRIRFRATFVQTAALFDTFHTGFTPNRFFNIVVWDDEANVWDAEVRSEPVTSLYFEKRREGAQVLSTLPKYTIIEIVGEVVSDFRDQPWINCHEIEVLGGVGALTDNAVYHIQRGIELADDGARDLADQHFDKALEVEIPRHVRMMVRQLQGENLLADGAYEAAARALAAALEVASEWAPAAERAELHYLRAKALSERAQQLRAADESEEPSAGSELFEAAVGESRTAVALDPELGDAYAVLGISLAGLERFSDAKQQCQRAIRMLPDNAEVRWYLGRIHNLENDYDAAVEVLREAIDRAPKDARLHKSIAFSFFARGKKGGPMASEDIVTALREYDIAIRLDPQDADLYYFSGLVMEHATERELTVRLGLKMVPASYQHAIERYESCVAVDDAYTEAHIRLGYRYRHADQHDEAVTHFKRALELEPDRDELYAELGDYLWELERREEAYDIYLTHHRRASDDYDTVYALGRLSLEIDEDARAVEWLERVVRELPEHAMAHADLVEAYAELGDTRDARSHAERALALLDDEDEKVRVHRFAGLAAWQDDDLQAVIRHLDGRVADSEDPRLLAALGWSLTTVEGRLDRVGELGARLAGMESHAAEGQELQAWAAYLQGKPGVAAAILQPLYAEQPENEVLAYRYGMALYKQGPAQYPTAKPVLEVARGVDEDREILEDARDQARDAYSEIRDWEREQERQRRQAEREAERAAREARRARED